MYRYYPGTRNRQPTLSPLVEEQFAPLASMEDISLSNTTPLSSPSITPPPSTLPLSHKKRVLEDIPEEKIERRYSRRFPRVKPEEREEESTIIVQTLPRIQHPTPVHQILPYSFIQPRRERVRDLKRYCYAPLSDSPGVDLQIETPPEDRLSLIYLTLILHGIGTQMSWNMFVTAKEYFVTYKLGKDYTNLNDESPYAMQFLQYFGYAAQVPNLILNWINIFLNWGENLTMRIVWTVLIEVIVFVITIVLAMVDSSNWPGLFFFSI
ncbi:SLC29A1_2_3 [Lepeophtheirus salmonis]|uniref:SLC29A1_2_3 n=1 Tax=Lepeophtheirus salmonis TaxID=72036 RepID=A0A7R8HDN3_LEPSM|nr:SLC29A1_2_3 [Lepeophtheirus salmonis]CAF3014348.1 SLC29A1_2_3 [Lepeophtheirus salmonis]